MTKNKKLFGISLCEERLVWQNGQQMTGEQFATKVVGKVEEHEKGNDKQKKIQGIKELEKKIKKEFVDKKKGIIRHSQEEERQFLKDELLPGLLEDGKIDASESKFILESMKKEWEDESLEYDIEDPKKDKTFKDLKKPGIADGGLKENFDFESNLLEDITTGGLKFVANIFDKEKAQKFKNIEKTKLSAEIHHLFFDILDETGSLLFEEKLDENTIEAKFTTIVARLGDSLEKGTQIAELANALGVTKESIISDFKTNKESFSEGLEEIKAKIAPYNKLMEDISPAYRKRMSTGIKLIIWHEFRSVYEEKFNLGAILGAAAGEGDLFDEIYYDLAIRLDNLVNATGIPKEEGTLPIILSVFSKLGEVIPPDILKEAFPENTLLGIPNLEKTNYAVLFEYMIDASPTFRRLFMSHHTIQYLLDPRQADRLETNLGKIETELTSHKAGAHAKKIERKEDLVATKTDSTVDKKTKYNKIGEKAEELKQENENIDSKQKAEQEKSDNESFKDTAEEESKKIAKKGKSKESGDGMQSFINSIMDFIGPYLLIFKQFEIMFLQVKKIFAGETEKQSIDKEIAALKKEMEGQAGFIQDKELQNAAGKGQIRKAHSALGKYFQDTTNFTYEGVASVEEKEAMKRLLGNCTTERTIGKKKIFKLGPTFSSWDEAIAKHFEKDNDRYKPKTLFKVLGVAQGTRDSKDEKKPGWTNTLVNIEKYSKKSLWQDIATPEEAVDCYTAWRDAVGPDNKKINEGKTILDFLRSTDKKKHLNLNLEKERKALEESFKKAEAAVVTAEDTHHPQNIENAKKKLDELNKPISDKDKEKKEVLEQRIRKIEEDQKKEEVRKQKLSATDNLKKLGLDESYINEILDKTISEAITYTKKMLEVTRFMSKTLNLATPKPYEKLLDQLYKLPVNQKIYKAFNK